MKQGELPKEGQKEEKGVADKGLRSGGLSHFDPTLFLLLYPPP